MKYKKTGRLIPDILESDIAVQLFEGIQKIMARMDFLLGLLKNTNSDCLREFVDNLNSEYQQLVLQKHNVMTKQSEVIEGLSNLREYPELGNSILTYYSQILQIESDQDWHIEKKKVKQIQEIRSFLHPRYYNLLALIKTLGRYNAIKLYKHFVTTFLISRENPDRVNFEGVEALFKMRTQPTRYPSPWVITHGLLSNGKYFYRNENCLWVDALADLPDSEMKYLICCYGDYQNFRYRLGNSVILTMEHTIAQGHPYCSRIVHDTTVDWNLKHPPKEFWDSIDDLD